MTIETREKRSQEEAFITLTRVQWYWVLEAMRAKVQSARCVNDKKHLRELELIERKIEAMAYAD